MTGNDDKNLEILDAIYNDAALTEAESGTASPDDKKWAQGVRSNVQARLAEMRRNLTPAVAPAKKAKPIRPSLLALGRDALVERLTQLTQKMGGAVQFAHRHLAGLSDDDLRRLIDTLEPNAED
ncbi:MAG: hypothetical protein HOV81_21410 [Kofleriaceae bacterium]|nr:hypothetical protein [Kofleriaceae bacterium]